MRRKVELTDAEAGDLARYFLGEGWVAARIAGRCLLRSRDETALRFTGDGWREAFREAGVRLPARSRYVKHGCNVSLDGAAVAVCVSGTKAQFVCDALNVYVDRDSP